MVFIGPTPQVIDGLGDKVSARRAAIKENVPVVPGTEGPVDKLSECEDFVALHGYPVIIKAAYGGGGRGMRVVREGDNLQDAFTRASSEYVSPATRIRGFRLLTFHTGLCRLSETALCSLSVSSTAPSTLRSSYWVTTTETSFTCMSATVPSSEGIRRSSRLHPQRTCPTTSDKVSLPMPSGWPNQCDTATPVPPSSWSTSGTDTTLSRSTPESRSSTPSPRRSPVSISLRRRSRLQPVRLWSSSV